MSSRFGRLGWGLAASAFTGLVIGVTLVFFVLAFFLCIAAPYEPMFIAMVGRLALGVFCAVAGVALGCEGVKIAREMWSNA